MWYTDVYTEIVYMYREREKERERERERENCSHHLLIITTIYKLMLSVNLTFYQMFFLVWQTKGIIFQYCN